MSYSKSFPVVRSLCFCALLAATACGQNPHFVDPAAAGKAAIPAEKTDSKKPETKTPDNTPSGIPSQSPSQTPSQSPDTSNQTKIQANCDELAALIRASEDGADEVTDQVLEDGTCVINNTRFPSGTTINVSNSDNGTIIYIINDGSGNPVEEFYTINGDVLVTVVFYLVQGNPSAGIPDRYAPGILLSRQFHFATGKWDILPSEKPIEKIVALAIEDAAKQEGSMLQTIEVQGHTDDVGGAVYNLGLSQKRAIEVRSALLRELNKSSLVPQLPWEQFLLAKGFGSSDPISGPSGKNRKGESVFTRKDRTLNRRVEIHFNY